MLLKQLLKDKKQGMGLAPGTLVPGSGGAAATIEVLDYNEANCCKDSIANASDTKAFFDSSKTQSWINFIGVHDTEKLKALAEVFDIHPLVLEDIANTHQRPKFEDWDNYLYVVITMLKPGAERFDQEQVSFILGENYLISFQEREGDVFNAVRARIEKAKGRVRKSSTDYLLYILLDAIIDHYFLVLESINNQVEELEGQVEEKVTNADIANIQKLKRETMMIRRLIAPTRELCQALIKSESQLISESNLIYFKDLQDHALQALESLDTLRDFISSLLEYCNSFISAKLNEIMKVLTMVSTVFIPITFIAGIYGMNFEHMPELQIPWAYPAAIGAMVFIVIGMFVYFKRKNWL